MGDGDYIDFRGSTFHGAVTGKSESPRAAPSPTAMSALPAAPAAFTGREDEVAELLNALDPGSGGGSESVVISAVAGLGGVGKTALALCVAHAARECGWFAGGALFVDLRGYDEVPVTADQAVLALLRALGVGDADLPPTADEQYARYRAELSAREPVLILLDNASDPAQIAPLLPGEGGGHRVLVTSREVQDSLPVRQFRVDGLAPDASRELIDQSLRRYDPGDRRVADEPEAVRQLAELCGHLPLALLIVSALLRRGRQRPIATLVSKLEVASDRVRALRFKGVDQYGKNLSLRPVLDMMYARLEPELAQAFRQLGQAPGDSIGIGPATNLTALVPEHLEPLLDELTAASLLTAASGAGRWVMHDLVRLYARTVSAEDSESRNEAAHARLRLLNYYCQGSLSAKALIQRLPDGIPDHFEGQLHQAVTWLDSERTGLLAAARWTDTDNEVQSRLAVGLTLSLDSYLDHRHAFQDWATVAESACDASRRFRILLAEAMASDGLGLALNGLRRFEEAIDAIHRARRLYEGLGDREGQAKTWNNLGLVLRALRRNDESVEAYAHSARLYTEVGKPFKAALVRGNLGVTLGHMGRLDEARTALEAACGAHVKLNDTKGEATVQNGLGVVLHDLGQLEESVTALTRALGLFAELGDWHNRAKAWNNLGITLRTLGQFDDGLAAHTRARDWCAFLGDRHTEASAWANMGNSLSDLCRFEEALFAARRALTLYEALDDTHLATNVRHNIDVIHQADLRPHP